MKSRLPELTLYTREDCSLCEEMHEALRDVKAQAPFHLNVVDVTKNAELLRKYGDRVPLLALDGRISFKTRIDPRKLRRKLRRASRATVA